MKSAISFWQTMAWNPLVELAGSYRVIAMDQRNAGQSSAPVSSTDGWHTYAADQLALLDHLQVDKFHVMGMCIGGPYAMGLIQAAAKRVRSAVLFQSIGLMEGAKNRDTFYAMFDSWADELKPTMKLTDSEWNAFRDNMYGPKKLAQGNSDSVVDDFLFNVGDEFVRTCSTPLCVLEGNDIYHPRETSLRIKDLAPEVVYIEHWKDNDHRAEAMAQVERFLAAH